MQNGAGLGADKICLNFIRKRTVFGGPHGQSGMMGMVVITGRRDSDIKSIASVLNEIGSGY